MAGRKPLNKNQQFKRQKVRDARAIRSEAVLFSEQEFGEAAHMLKVPDFVSSRKFELVQLQNSIHRSRHSSSTRVFQSLPRRLRRRTASHNVKRIPKRMRNRALREMAKSNQTVTSGTKDSLKKKKHGLSARKLYRLKMTVNLLRLASRNVALKLAMPAEVAPAKFKLRASIRSLRQQIRAAQDGKAVRKLNNSLGSYDNTGFQKLAPKPLGRIKYMKRQRTFTWLPTHVWHAKRSHMVKRWGFQIPWSPTQKCFRMTHRLTGSVASSNGAMCADTSYIGTMVVKSKDSVQLTDFVKQLTDGRASRKKYKISQHLFEGLFYEISNGDPLGPGTLLWIDPTMLLIRLHPAIYEVVFKTVREKFEVQDCRYSIASITITGGKALQALSHIIRTTNTSESYKQFKSVCNVSDSSIFPHRAIFAFNVIDPRHLSSPKKVSESKEIPSASTIVDLATNYPADKIFKVLQKLCDAMGRENSYKNQQTLKQLAKRRQMLLRESIHTNMIPYDASTDPEIPVVLIRQPKTSNWLVLIPWFWMLPFWYQLNRVPHVYHMGLKQLHQQNYERGLLHFPDDYSFTAVGQQELLYKAEAAKGVWERKPSGKRINYGKVGDIHASECPGYTGEIGEWFGSDWKLLQILQNGVSYLGTDIKTHNSERTTQYDAATGLKQLNCVRDLLQLYDDVRNRIEESQNLPINLFNQGIGNFKEHSIVTEQQPPQLSIANTPLSVIAIVCEAVERGHFKDNSRLYAISDKDIPHWIEAATGNYRPNGKRNHELEHPKPKIQDLIGFITSGTYHLSEGKSLGNGFLATNYAAKSKHNYILVRNIGTNIYRLATWQQILV
ncbi:ribonuclease P/MRP protein subunit POP1 Ecym_6470 [Eremothecium cymbalariae DBVPG|uniref:Uncharacterized protein n=1 Tax=Eremothecium cymbalariae (strain CBS 270.75 / DBVPG 7215 / KCTC 17166 / NRRL Y-17582) TaxID=931890 RepID=G8JUR1_ERECY|nr:hypothetical protein Ecym_6470 [Eremothecium cymbalariae DBVPG\